MTLEFAGFLLVCFLIGAVVGFIAESTGLTGRRRRD